MKNLVITESLFGHDITAAITVLDVGTHVLLYGGERSHIGAISYVSPEGELNNTVFPTHKEGLLSEMWAKRIAELGHLPVVVEAGIHYDNATKEQIMEIVKVTSAMLEQAVSQL